MKMVRMSCGLLTALALCALVPRAVGYERLDHGVWYLRVTNPTGAAQRLCVRVYFNPNQKPWYGDVAYLCQTGETEKLPGTNQWLAPGASSPWMDLSPHMSRRPTFGSADQYLSPVLLGAMYAHTGQSLRLVAELACGRLKRVQRRIEIDEPRPTWLGAATWLGGKPLPTAALLVPIDPGSGQRILTAEEAARQQLDWIAACGPTPTPPRDILFIAHQWQVAYRNPTHLQELNTGILRQLGYNNLVQFAKDSNDVAAIRAAGWEPVRAIHVGRRDAAKKAAELKDKGLWEWVRLANFGDEIDIRLDAKPEQQDAAFVAYLRERGFRPIDFVRPADEARAAALPEAEQWGLVHLGGPLPPAKTKLFFEAATFRYRLWTRELAADTEAVRQAFPPGTDTGANFSPHLSVWPDVRKWINIFRDGGMTMPWSEDWWWQVPEASPQSYGLLLDGLRRAADYRGAPFCFYTITDPGATPAHLLRMNYFALGHQAKVIDHFNIYNQILGTCDYIDFVESRDKFPVIRRILGDVGRIDARLARARLVPAEAGIILSIASDVWNTEDLLSKDPPQENLYHATMNLENHERKALWLALRHAQFPVDLLTDEDVAAGVPERFKVLYVVGPELLAGAAPRLRAWVEAGGTLVAVGGGGVLNQYREMQPAMTELYGLVDARLTRQARTVSPSRDLPGAAPVDTLTFDAAYGGVTLPAYYAKQELSPTADSRVVAYFANGDPAAVERRQGKGRVLIMGALPGLAYLAPGQAARQKSGGHLPLLGAARRTDRNRMPEVFPEDVRRLIAEPAETAGVQRPVRTSDALVEATLQQGDKGAVVTLISFRNDPVEALTVTLSGLPAAKAVTSLRHGKLEVRQSAAGPQVTVPVDQGDFLVVD